jgi:predicted RNA-binding protein with PIN domain
MAVTVLVDARNVLRSKWPNIPEQRLVALCATWASENGHDIVVVFDRKAPGGLVGQREDGSGCAVVGTGSESADDWLAREASSYAPYWLVTSDRELRARAGGRAEEILGGGSFARTLDP